MKNSRSVSKHQSEIYNLKSTINNYSYLLVHWSEDRFLEVGRGLYSLQMRVAEAAVIVQRHGYELVFAFQQELNR